MISEKMRNYLEDEFCGITTRAPFIVQYKDKKGAWYESSFEDAPSWKYWDKLDANMQYNILNRLGK